MAAHKGSAGRAFHISLLPLCIVLLVSSAPFLLHALGGIDFSLRSANTGIISLVIVAFNVVSITLALLTVLLCYIDFWARKDVSSPILAVSLLSASIIDTVAVLYESNLVTAVDPTLPIADVSAFIGLFSRTFHAVSLLVGVLIFTAKSQQINEEGIGARQFVGYMSLILILLTSLVAIVLLNNNYFPSLQSDSFFIPRPFELLPLLVYLFLGFVLIPRFYRAYPTMFSQAIFLSLIPASIMQLHFSIGSTYYYDNDYMITFFLRAIMYFIPFAGIALNYYATITNERKMIRDLHHEADERGKAEQMLTSIFNTSPSGIIAYSAMRDEQNRIYDFRIELYNDTARKLNAHYTNWESGTMSELFSNNWENGLFEKYVQVVENNQVMDEELFAEPLNGWFRIAARRRGNNGVTVVFNDITKIKNYEADLENKVLELNRSNHELEEFAYIASHDLQEPLRKIRTFGNRLAEVNENRLDAKSMDYIHRMNDAALRMQTLIGDLMEYSRVSRKNNEAEPVSIHAVWQEVLDDLEMLIEQKQADISSSDLPVMVVNKVKIHQLFYNLLSNSLKFTVPGRKPVISLVYRVTSEINEQTGKTSFWHHFLFSDNGIGFNQAYADKVFLLFQRLHGKEEYPGSGIGLSVCKKIVENLDGRISVNSKEGEGTTFTIRFPKS